MESLYNTRNLILINLLVMVVYMALYRFVSTEWQEGFPVQLAVYVSVHGIGMLILSSVNRAMKDFAKSKTFMLTGFAILGAGWLLLLLLF